MRLRRGHLRSPKNQGIGRGAAAGSRECFKRIVSLRRPGLQGDVGKLFLVSQRRRNTQAHQIPEMVGRQRLAVDGLPHEDSKCLVSSRLADHAADAHDLFGPRLGMRIQEGNLLHHLVHGGSKLLLRGARTDCMQYSQPPVRRAVAVDHAMQHLAHVVLPLLRIGLASQRAQREQRALCSRFIDQELAHAMTHQGSLVLLGEPHALLVQRHHLLARTGLAVHEAASHPVQLHSLLISGLRTGFGRVTHCIIPTGARGHRLAAHPPDRGTCR